MKTFLRRAALSGLLVFAFIVPELALAQAPIPTPVIVTSDIAETINRAADATKEISKNAVINSVVTYMINLMTFAADQAAYEAAVRIASSGSGETPLVETRPWSTFLNDVASGTASQAISLLDEEITGPGGVLRGFNLCAPSDPNILLSFKIGIRAAFERQTPRCDINVVTANWKSFLADVSTDARGGAFRNQLILTRLADAFDPNTNEFSVGVALQSDIIDGSIVNARVEQDQRLANKDFKAVTDFITGEVETPASMISQDWEWKLNRQGELRDGLGIALVSNTDALLQVGIHAGSIFTNTLLSKLTERIYSGLFDFSGTAAGTSPFDGLAFGRSGAEEARSSFKGVFTAQPLQISNYSILADFSSCPSTGRGLYNCVADNSLVSAVARTSSGIPVTVKDAMDSGLLKGGWPLIPSGDHARNQDPFCYTYGYCYGNLVKLRKARVISVGWEFAANSPFNPVNNPVTLKEVVDGFDDCNAGGQPDEDHPWCKLIDPEWVLKYPQTQCRANVNGQLLTSAASDERQSECVDMPSCISEDQNGNCTGGYGYCVREENTWEFRGQSCPAEFASCITVKNDEKTVSYLKNTTDSGPCTEDNAGCQWYATSKTDPEGDGTFAFQSIPSVAAADADPNAYKARTYFTAAVEECDSADGGCRQVIPRSSSLSLNMIENPSFDNDADRNNTPDSWIFTNPSASIWDNTGTRSRSGQGSVQTNGGILYQPGVEFSQSRFYTMSFYARQESGGNTESAELIVALGTDDGTVVDLSGTSVTTGCLLQDGNGDGRPDMVKVRGTPVGETYERFTCTFTSPTLPSPITKLFAFIDLMQGGALVDDIQVEQGARVTPYHDGYSSGNVLTQAKVVKVAPDYLGCTGSVNDPAECSNYAKVCSENDVGCSAYTPQNGDPVVTGVASEVDACPAACVGYDTYKQEPTLYEPSGQFPLYFIPSSAQSCSARDVGCDEFTNLTDESKSYFTYVRACVTPQAAQANTSSDNEATFYTWEGSDNTGYQLKTWHLLESNLGASDYNHAFSNELDTTPGSAPCSTWVADGDGISCTDERDINGDQVYDWDSAACDEHADIFSNGDCREFYDANGGIHFRLWSKTVTVDAACTSYRKTEVAGIDESQRQLTCSLSGGFFDLASGTCRYFGMASESRTCSAQANGCRAYTGGRSRNSRVAYQDVFEGGSLSSWTASSAAAVTYSNESLATGGHSVSATIPFETFVGDNGTTCTSATGCPKTGGALGAGCTVANGRRYCGTLEGQLFSGKTYTLSFWAKGTGTLTAGFDYQASGTVNLDANFGAVTLTSGWQQYSLGPLNMNAAGFGSGTALGFIPSGSAFVDNIVLREGQDNITLIKNSWVTPLACDQTPTGASAPQYYLGCQAYTDQEGQTANLKSFSKLCSDDKVGCSSFFMTQESVSPHAEVHNARCNTLDGLPVNTATACYYGVSGTSYNTLSPFLCTIGVGQTSCAFDLSWYVAPANLPAHLKFSPSTLITPADKDVFLVVTDAVTCSSGTAGCTEYGKPKYNLDRTATTGADSVYRLNDPSRYAETLCTQDELYCQAWTGTGGKQYYFKDPGTKTCEYRTDVTINGTSYDGWFKTGTNELCYDTPPYVVGGNLAGIWKNGDTQYDGWVGTCTTQYDSCSEFQDPLDVKTSELYGNADGTQYYSLTSSVSSARTAAAGECNGKVSLKQGCALFNDTSIAAKTANASATEIASRHADKLFNAAPFSLVEPIRCNGGANPITLPDGTTVDLCAKRCVYDKGRVNDITDGIKIREKLIAKASGTPYTTDDIYLYGTSCYQADDCTSLTSESGEVVNPSACSTVVIDVAPASLPAVPRLEDDANTVLAVNRSRQCSEWLSCADAQTVWDERSNSYKTICGEIALCTEYSAQGNSSFCSQWNFENPKTALTAERYTSRDVSWYGDDYSGFAVPELYPVESLKQENIAPPALKCELTPLLASGAIDQATFDANQGNTCATTSDCDTGASGAEGTAIRSRAESCPATQENEFRLVFNAGTCTGDYGASCTVGTCANTGSSCSTTTDCGSSGGSCLVGQCFVFDETDLCTSDAECGTGRVCSGGICATPDPFDREVTIERYNAPDTVTPPCFTPDQTFVPNIGLKNGTCVNSACVLAPNGNAFAFGTSEAKICRAYPEVTSPFSSEVVESWFDTEEQEKLLGGNPSLDDLPYDTRSGFENAKTCAPGEDCMCTYKKVTYGEGGESRYYSRTYAPDGNGVCSSGVRKGAFCGSNAECPDEEGNPGTCSKATREDVLLGLDGYCLERDSAINVNGDRNQNACITWLPVDQLAGSSDLYGKSTEAGLSTDLFFCGEVGGFSNMVPKLGCAHIPGNPTGEDRSNRAFCKDTVKCPPGFWAVAGPLNFSNSDGDPHSVAGNACEAPATDVNKCPYMCIPFNSFHDGTGAACKSPRDESLDVTVSNGGLSTYGRTQVYFAIAGDENEMYSDIDEMFNFYKDCTYFGTDVEGDELGVYTFPSSGNIDGVSGTDYDLINSPLDPEGYAACRSLVQASAVDGGSVENAVWTDRLFNPDSDLSEIAVGAARYKIDTELSPWGRSITEGEAKSGTNVAHDPMPAIIPTCVDATAGTTARRPTDPENPGVCPSGYEPAFGNDLKQAQTYLDWSAMSVQFDNPSHGKTTGGEATLSSVTNRLRQIIALPQKIWTWSNAASSRTVGGRAIGLYNAADPDPGLDPNDLSWDDRATEGNPPSVWAIDPASCRGSECEEGPANSLTLNDQNSGDQSAVSFFRASLKFYAAADKNQLPLRRVIVDWGDGGNTSGSSSEDNFYKNHRGLQDGSTDSKCQLETEWGLTNESCDPNYLTYSHIYTCPSTMLLDASRACTDTNGDGRPDQEDGCVVNQGTAEAACVFQPRVHVRDNWGWCSGVCTAGPENTAGCYDSDGGLGSVDANKDECLYEFFTDPTAATNPWVYYGGTVTVNP